MPFTRIIPPPPAPERRSPEEEARAEELGIGLLPSLGGLVLLTCGFHYANQLPPTSTAIITAAGLLMARETGKAWERYHSYDKAID